MTEAKVNITIPTYNRAAELDKAITTALSQSYSNLGITVIDNGSDDHTWRVLQNYQSEQNFGAIRLNKQADIAKVKNTSVLLSHYDAISFHQLGDIPSEHKTLIQARTMNQSAELDDEEADELADHEIIGACLNIDIVISAYKLITMNGKIETINNQISLVDDFFPNLQFPSKGGAEKHFMQTALFRKRVFEKVGGYVPGLEHNKEFRNRTIGAGLVYYFVDEPLLTKIEGYDHNDLDRYSKFKSFGLVKRKNDKEKDMYKQKIFSLQMNDKSVSQIDLADVQIEDTINSHHFNFNEGIACTEETQDKLRHMFASKRKVLSLQKSS